MKHIILALLATPAAAEQCNTSDVVTTVLAGEFGESVRFVGLDKHGNIIVLYVNSDTETWTLHAVSPDNCSAPITSGEGGGVIVPVVPPEGDPA